MLNPPSIQKRISKRKTVIFTIIVLSNLFQKIHTSYISCLATKDCSSDSTATINSGSVIIKIIRQQRDLNDILKKMDNNHHQWDSNDVWDDNLLQLVDMHDALDDNLLQLVGMHDALDDNLHQLDLNDILDDNHHQLKSSDILYNNHFQ